MRSWLDLPVTLSGRQRALTVSFSATTSARGGGAIFYGSGAQRVGEVLCQRGNAGQDVHRDRTAGFELLEPDA